jgi:HSP20 family protein
MLIRTDLFQDLDRLTNQLWGSLAKPSTIPLDAYKEGDHYVVEFDLPGVDPESIDITIEKNLLSVHAVRPYVERDNAGFIASERSFGSFTRQLFLSDNLDTDNIEADYTNGVLKVRIPVAEKAKPRKVRITTGKKEPAALSA